MQGTGLASFMVLLLPVYLGITRFGMDIYGAWICLLAFIGTMFLFSAGRYGLGKWRTMLVIERQHHKPDIP